MLADELVRLEVIDALIGSAALRGAHLLLLGLVRDCRHTAAAHEPIPELSEHEVSLTAYLNARMQKYAAGPANRSASIRSSMPPWPPSRLPVSFTFMSRLRSDSNRSPSGATTASRPPSAIDSPIVRKCCL